MNWTKEEEAAAKKEYLSLIDSLSTAEEFEHEWIGEWDDHEKQTFGKRKTKVKGDKHKFMKYWLEDQDIINDVNWNKIDNEDEYF